MTHVPAWKPRVFDALLAWQHDRPAGVRGFSINATGHAFLSVQITESDGGFPLETRRECLIPFDEKAGDMTPEQLRARIDDPFAEVG